jgi:protocatechuate 3,4-dioxygenase alpha subunit
MTITPSQTIGPFFRVGMAWLDAEHLVAPDRPGAITITGRVLDGAGDEVPDAAVEIWQADAAGAFPQPTTGGWCGFGRCLTDDSGRFRFVTIKPGPVDERQAPHIDVSVFARGLLQRVVTRMYFPDEPAANDADPVLRSIIEPASRSTLVATGEETDLCFDVHLQGERETVFFVC